jgi:fumarate reductase flavoprotein subunit
MEGKLTVRVTVAGGKVTAVVVTEHGETESMKSVRTALAEVPKRIVEKGGVEVDAVSGATMTSKAIREAVAEALKSAVE